MQKIEQLKKEFKQKEEAKKKMQEEEILAAYKKQVSVMFQGIGYFQVKLRVGEGFLRIYFIPILIFGNVLIN